MNPILLKGGRVIDPASNVDGAFDVLIANGEIEAVERANSISPPDGALVIDAIGYWVMPGLVDPHVHLRDPGFPEKETVASGLRAAAAGGFTTVAAMANTNPVCDSPEVVRYMLERANEAHASRLIPVSAVTRGLAGVELVDFGSMVEAGARLFSDDGVPIDDQVVLSRAFDEVAQLGYAVSLHEEDRALSHEGAMNAGEVSERLGVAGYPDAAESRRVRRDLALAIGSGAAMHVAHVSTTESIDLIRAARRNGARVTCEATPHHFTLDESSVLRWGPNAKMNPPLRCLSDVRALRAAIADGTVDMIATDHAPHDAGSKNLDRLIPYFSGGGEASGLPRDAAECLSDAANGIVGLETALGLAFELVHKSEITPTRMIEMMSRNPAALLRIDPGTLAPGAAADVTIADPSHEWTVAPDLFRTKSRNTPFAGMRLRGRAMITIVGGEIVFDARTGAPG